MDWYKNWCVGTCFGFEWNLKRTGRTGTLSGDSLISLQTNLVKRHELSRNWRVVVGCSKSASARYTAGSNEIWRASEEEWT